MVMVKIIIYSFIFITTSLIGLLKSKKYIYRVDELKEFKGALNIFKNKLKFTYETIPEIFIEIANTINSNTTIVFKIAAKRMKIESAEEAWENAINISILNITKEDRELLKNFGNLLGKTDIEGQLNQVELTTNFLDEQIKLAEKEKIKNEKLYRTLGMTIGLGIVIVLI